MQKIILMLLFSLVFLSNASQADFKSGLTAANSGNTAAAIKEFTPLAEGGSIPAQFNLGLLYEQGNGGLPLDINKAIKWYKLASEHNYAEAQFRLGQIYDLGIDVPEDQKEALKWFRLAAENNDPSALEELGNYYMRGDGGVQIDKKEAFKWFRLAADKGSVYAQSVLAHAYRHGNGVQQNLIIAYALNNQAVINSQGAISKPTVRAGEMAAETRTELFAEMSTQEIAAAQQLSRKMGQSGNLLKALDQYERK